MTGQGQINSASRDSLAKLINEQARKTKQYQDSFLHQQDSALNQQIKQPVSRTWPPTKEEGKLVEIKERIHLPALLLSAIAGLIILLVLVLVYRKRKKH